jgi:hypothetical protein
VLEAALRVISTSPSTAVNEYQTSFNVLKAEKQLGCTIEGVAQSVLLI